MYYTVRSKTVCSNIYTRDLTAQYRPDSKLSNVNIELWSVDTILKHLFFIALLYTAKMSSKVQPPNSSASLTTLL